MSTTEQTATAPASGRRSTLARAWMWLVALGGVALAAVAAVDLVRGDGGGPVTTLLIVGAVLAIGPLILDRLIGVSVGVDGLRFDLSQEIAGLGAAGTAKRVDEWGGGLAEAAHAYATAHTVLRGDGLRAARVKLQDHFVDAAAASALVQQYDAGEVRKLFRNGPPVVRVLVLGLMLGDPSLADAATIESAITQSRTANEQYHGLQLAKRVGRRLPAEERQQLRAAIEREPIPGGDRTELRAEVLVLLADEGDAGAARGGARATTATAAESVAS